MRFNSLLVVFLLALFIMPTAFSYDYNFVANYTINSFRTDGRFKCFADRSNYDDYWLCYYVKNSDSKLYIQNFTPSFISVSSVSDVCIDASGCLNADCNWISGTGDGNVIDCIGKEDDSPPGQESFRYKLSDNTLNSVYSKTADGNYYFFQSQVNDHFTSTGTLKMQFKLNDLNPKYTYQNLPGSTLTLPSSLQGYPTDMQLAYCDGYYHIIEYKDNKFLDIIYDTDLNFQRSYYLTTSAGLYPAVDDWGIWADISTDTIYLTATNSTRYGSTDYPFIEIDAYSCSDGFVSPIDSQIYNQTDIEPTANHTANIYMQKPYLTKDNHGLFALFYEFRSGSSYTMKSVLEGSDCSACSNFIPQDECQLNKQRYDRVCPSGSTCTNITQWIETTYCGALYNQSQGIYKQEYENYVVDANCLTDTTEPPNTLQCKFKENIPVNCENISVKIEAFPNWIKPGFGCDKGNWTLQVCNPDITSECSSEIKSCDDLNSTLSKTYSSYISGTSATGSALLQVDYSCQCYISVFGQEVYAFGITKYSLGANFKVTCQVPYNNEWICDDQGVYEKYQHIDGTFTNETFCTNGCNNVTGRCYNSKIDNPKEKSNPGYWINSIVNPNDSQKITWSFLYSFLLGLLITGIISSLNKGQKDFKDLGITFFIGFGVGVILFTIAGWLPFWIILTTMLLGVGGIALKNLGNH